MKHLFLLLAFFLPSLSFASFVPPQVPISINTYYASTTYSAYPYNSTNVFYEYITAGGIDPGSPYTSYYIQSYVASTPNLTTATSAVGLGITRACFGGSGGFPLNSTSSQLARMPYFEFPACDVLRSPTSDEFIFVNFYFVSGSGGSYIYDLMGFAKFRLDGTTWVSTINPSNSSWDFSTSTDLLPVDFSDFAQGIKDGINNNTTNPSCPSFSSILEIGGASFWQDCVLPTIFNWLFVPSDSAIDYMIDQLSSSSGYGSSFAYMLIMPIASAVSVSACDLDNPSACDVGSPLVLPVLDVYGSSTPYSLDPVSPLPSYFDDWLSAIVAVLILAGVSRVVLHKFL